ncbi:MAG: hypothetical protein U0414_07040 [Polyangiaceae bacterium]
MSRADRLLRGEALARAIADRAPAARDAFVDDLLAVPAARTDDYGDARASPPPDRIDFVPSGVSAIADAILKSRIGASDTLVDVGAGFGRVAALVHLLTGAQARGIELQPALVERGNAWLRSLGLGSAVRIERADAIDAELTPGTVFYLYLPFIGETQRTFFRRLEEVARQRQIGVCTLGVDLRDARWLRSIDDSSLWLTAYESAATGATPRTIRPAYLPSLRWVAEERARPSAT